MTRASEVAPQKFEWRFLFVNLFRVTGLDISLELDPPQVIYMGCYPSILGFTLFIEPTNSREGEGGSPGCAGLLDGVFPADDRWAA